VQSRKEEIALAVICISDNHGVARKTDIAAAVSTISPSPLLVHDLRKSSQARRPCRSAREFQEAAFIAVPHMLPSSE
jgi:hypothetical protein